MNKVRQILVIIGIVIAIAVTSLLSFGPNPMAQPSGAIQNALINPAATEMLIIHFSGQPGTYVASELSLRGQEWMVTRISRIGAQGVPTVTTTFLKAGWTSLQYNEITTHVMNLIKGGAARAAASGGSMVSLPIFVIPAGFFDTIFTPTPSWD